MTKLLSLKIDMPKPFMGNLLAEEILSEYFVLQHPGISDDIILYIKHSQLGKEQLGGEFEISIVSDMEFTLSNKNEIQAYDVYKCLVINKEYLQKVVSTMFENQKAFIEVKIHPFGDEIEYITDALVKVIH